ncbi:MAG: ATP-binding protein [bacterium]|nr:ATP-binding protein [bacterium]
MIRIRQTTKQLIHGMAELHQRIAELDRAKEHSEQLRLEENLGNVRDELEARVAERTANLQHVNQRLQAEINQRKQVEAELRMAKDYAENIIKSSLDIIICVDPQRNITEFNRAAQRAFGYSKAEILGQSIDLLYADVSEGMALHSHLVEGGEGYTAEITNKRQDGTSFDAFVSASPMRDTDGNIIGVTGISRDITTLKRGQEELRQAKEAAEAANQAKSEFLANMSHELRTPLHCILGFSRRGLKKALTATPQKLHDYFAQIDQSGGSLLTLLNDLLDLAKLEVGKMSMSFEPVDLHVLLATVVDEFHSLLDERDLMLQYTPPDDTTKVVLDPGKISQVVRNLLNNSVKLSPQGGMIALNIRRAKSCVLVAVIDQGPGIPEAELEAVFDKFVQSSETKNGAGGTGLGLAISREIITAHRGHIWAQNSPQGGAVFAFALPWQRPDEVRVASALVGDGEHTMPQG